MERRVAVVIRGVDIGAGGNCLLHDIGTTGPCGNLQDALVLLVDGRQVGARGNQDVGGLVVVAPQSPLKRGAPKDIRGVHRQLALEKLGEFFRLIENGSLVKLRPRFLSTAGLPQDRRVLGSVVIRSQGHRRPALLVSNIGVCLRLEERFNAFALVLSGDMQGSLAFFILCVNIRPGGDQDGDQLRMPAARPVQRAEAIIVAAIDVGACGDQLLDLVHVQIAMAASKQQRSLAVVVDRIDVGFSFEQIGNRFFAAAAVNGHGKMQGSVAILVFGIDVRACRQENGYNVGPKVVGCVMQRCRTLKVPRVGVCAGGQ